MSESEQNAIEGILEQLSNASSTQDSVRFIRQLGREDNPHAIATLMDYAHHDTIAIARTAIHALANYAPCDDLVALLPLLKHAHDFVRKAVVETLGQSGCGDFVPHLVTLLGDDTLDALVREALIALKVDPNFF